MGDKKETKVIAFANQKGGVGKTTSVLNIGVGLANRGNKVLLIDADSQANLTMGLGEDPDEIEFTLTALLDNLLRNNLEIPDQIEEYIIKNVQGIDLIPSDINLQETETKLSNSNIARERFLAVIIERFKEQYDYVLIDCPPSIGMLTINAFTAADGILIITEPQIFSAKGSEMLMQKIMAVQKFFNSKLKPIGVIITKVPPRSNNARDIMRDIEAAYGQFVPIFKHTIPMSVKAGESNSAGENIYQYDPKGKIAQAYEGCVKELEGYLDGKA